MVYNRLKGHIRGNLHKIKIEDCALLVVELFFFFLRDFCCTSTPEAEDEAYPNHEGKPKPKSEEEAGDDTKDNSNNYSYDCSCVLGGPFHDF